MSEPKRYGAKLERSWTIEESPGQTAQEIVNDDTWDADDLVHQLARDLIAAQTEIAGLLKAVAAAYAMADAAEKALAEQEAYTGKICDKLAAKHAEWKVVVEERDAALATQARKDAEISARLNELMDGLANRDVRIRDLESSNERLCANLTETRSLLHTARNEVGKIAVAKPVMTAEEARTLDLVERKWPHLAPVIVLCRTLRSHVSVPKAPLTDQDLIDMLEAQQNSVTQDRRESLVEDVVRALRARGGL